MLGSNISLPPERRRAATVVAGQGVGPLHGGGCGHNEAGRKRGHERFHERAREVIVSLPLQGTPRSLGRRLGGLRDLGYLGPSGRLLAGLLLEWKWRRDVQNPLAADKGKRFLARILCALRVKMYLQALCHLAGENPKSLCSPILRYTAARDQTSSCILLG